METERVRCLLLACGNSLRGDDGVGPWLAAWAAERFAATAGLRTIARMQWTAELAQDLAEAEAAIFIDASTVAGPGTTQLRSIAPSADSPAFIAHQLGAPELLALTHRLYNFLPRTALLLTIGIGSTEMSETFSAPVQQALTEACSLLEDAIRGLVTDPQRS